MKNTKTFAIVVIQEAQRKIGVQYAKRVVGRKMYGGQSTYIPLRLIQGGVLPIIFASALLQFPLVISNFIPVEKQLDLIFDITEAKSVGFLHRFGELRIR